MREPWVQPVGGCFLAVLMCLSWALQGSRVRAAEPLSAEIVLQRGSQIEVSAAVYSPDGRIIASGGESEVIRLWDRFSGDLVRTLPGHPERVVGLAFSPDGQQLASCSTDGSVHVWDYRNGQLLHRLTHHVGNWTRRVTFSPDSRLLAGATYDGKLSLWDAKTGDVLRTLPTQERVVDLVFTPDGRSVVTAFRNSNPAVIQFWDVASGAAGLRLERPQALNALAISRDGRLLAAGGERGIVSFWELPSGRGLQELVMPQGDAVQDIDLSPDGRHLATSGQWVSRVWEVKSKSLVCELKGHEDGTVQISFSAEADEVLTGSSDASVRQWDARSGRLRRVLARRPPDAPITSIAFGPDGRFEAVGGVDGVVRVWDTVNGGCLYTLRGHEGPVHALAFSADGAWLFSGSADRTMRVWDMGHGTVSAHHPFFDRVDVMGAIVAGGLEGLVATAGGAWASGSLDHTIKMWQSHFDRPVRVLKGHASNVRALAFAKHKDLLASAGSDGSLKLWNSRTGKVLQTAAPDPCVESLAFTPDDSLLVAGAANGRVLLFDPERLSVVRQWEAHRRPVRSIAFNGDGAYMATASPDQTLAVWDTETFAERHRWTNVTSQYLPVAFHPQQPVIAFAPRDEMVVHASVTSGELLFQRVQFPDGEWLAWNPTKAFYAASPKGQEHARVRFAGQLQPVYPLQLYEKELNRNNQLTAALAGPAPWVQPKNLRLWWYHYPYKQAWLYTAMAAAAVWLATRLRHGWIDERKRRAQENISRQLLVSQEAERKRIAAELHDSLGQNLLIIKNRLYLAQKRQTGEAAIALGEISHTVSQTIEEVREISHNLRPYQLDRLGLTKAIKAVVRKVAESGSLRVESHIVSMDGLFSPEGEINLYRIVQESLSNILKHSSASVARIVIGRTPTRLMVTIEDDGKGFDYRRLALSEDHCKSFGMTGLNERVRILGGRFDCQTSPGRGTRLTFEIPVPAPHEA